MDVVCSVPTLVATVVKKGTGVVKILNIVTLASGIMIGTEPYNQLLEKGGR
jgi:hypothetical protein